MAENKVIGGEFEIEVQQSYQMRNALPEDVVTYSSGRSALYNILAYLKEKCGIKSVLFPDYLCESVYQMAEKNDMGVEFYALDEQLNPDVKDMKFVELPFRDVEDFDYPSIAKMIEEDGAKIIWVALGAPKQEKFMNKLLPYLKSGVMIAVGAAFKFYSGTDEKRCPKWIQKHHLEFVYRICQDPKKQLKRCFWIVATLPKLYYEEWKRKNAKSKEHAMLSVHRSSH